jgi:hypothetical protein
MTGDSRFKVHQMREKNRNRARKYAKYLTSNGELKEFFRGKPTNVDHSPERNQKAI